MISRSNYGPMTIGETRTFKIDKRQKKDCGLSGENVVEVEIKKEQSIIFASSFRMMNPKAKAYIHCDYGYVSYLEVQGKAKKCGIGKILMQLCLNEEKIHNVEANNKNEALNRMDVYIEDCKEKESCRKNDQVLERFQNLKEWITSHCSKLIYLEMQAEPKSAAHVYFTSAMASGFAEMFMISEDAILSPHQEIMFYPKEGPCAVKTLQEQYSDEGYIKKTMVWGMNWFFCHPKKPRKPTKCTIL